MRSLLKRYNAWNIRRKQLSLARWAEEREKGKVRFVLYQAFTFTVLMTASRDVITQFFDGRQAFNAWEYLIVYGIAGVCASCWGWTSREGKYKDAQINKRLQTPFDDRIKPR